MPNKKMHIKITKKRDGVFEVEGVNIQASTKEEAIRKYSRVKKVER